VDALVPFLTTPFMGQATWLWLVFVAVVLALLVFDLGVLHKHDREIGIRESLLLSAGYISVALLFGLGLWVQLGAERGIEYFTGFVIEKSLSMDNVFVIALIFSYFAVPRAYQHRVLFWGILGVIVLRALMIGLGAALVTQFSWVLYLFGAFLVLTGIKMLLMAAAARQRLLRAPAAPGERAQRAVGDAAVPGAVHGRVC
jgi:tellurite resistance protein TerC